MVSSSVLTASSGSLPDRAHEEAASQRRWHQRVHAPRARRFARDGDLRRVAAESGDVALHPIQRRDLIEHAVVARRMLRLFGGERRMGEVAEWTETVRDGS